jgi:uncharacterized protein YbaP (TraB family)
MTDAPMPGDAMPTRRSSWPLLVLGYLCLVAALIAVACATQKNCPPSAASLVPQGGWASAPPQTQDHGLLWRIEKDGRVSWLYGTAHIARPEWMRPGPKAQEALQQSDVVALEVNLETDPTVRQMQAGPSNGKAVADQLTKAQRERLTRLLAKSCLSADLSAPVSQLGLMRLLASLNGSSTHVDGLYAEFGIDRYLAGHARQVKMPLIGLETGAGQLKALGGDGRSKSLSETIDKALDTLESDKWRTVVVAAASAWARGDLDKLEHYADWCDCLKTPEDQAMHERMTTGRNPGMAKEIERLHADGKRVFAAVGALHMVGQKGLPAMLAEHGFQVMKVFPAEHQ